MTFKKGLTMKKEDHYYCYQCQKWIDIESDYLHFLDDMKTCRLIEETSKSIARHELNQEKEN